jgi:hypothetical protein
VLRSPKASQNELATLPIFRKLPMALTPPHSQTFKFSTTLWCSTEQTQEDERQTKPFSDIIVPHNTVYKTFSQHTFKRPTKVQDCRYNLRTTHIQKTSQSPNLLMKSPVWCAKEYTTLLLLLLSLDVWIYRRPNPWKLHQSLGWIKGVRKQTIKYMLG